MPKFKGLIAAAYQPLDADGQLNLKTVEPYADFLISKSVSGVFVNGSTGDFSTLSTEERKRIVEQWCQVKPKDLGLIVHVGDTNIDHAIELARHAGQLKVDAISALAPYYFKPANNRELVAICKSIALQAPDIPFYFYHIPELSGVNFDMIEFLELADKEITNLGGIKYSQQDLIQLACCANFQNGKYELLFGVDEILLCGIMSGATGAVGSTYNYLAPLNHRMIDAYKNGLVQEAQALQLQVIQLVNILSKYGFHAASKHVLKLMGVDLGSVRLPLKSLTNEQIPMLEQELAASGIFELV